MKISVLAYAERRPYPQWRFLQLTLVILVWIALMPLMKERWAGHVAMQTLLFDLLLVTLWANPQWGRLRVVVLALWALSLVVSVCSVLGVASGWRRVENTLDVAFMIPVTLACVVGVATFAFRAHRPTLDGVFAMVVAYLLIAMTFAELYYLVLIWNPDAIKLLAPTETMPPHELRGQLMYFSVITLSTVGYGDILPLSDAARMLAMLEAVVGQFFVAVVVAMFVSLYTTNSIEERARARDEAARNATLGEEG
ncbi:MAG: potassium channel family protein [Steroidobacteraceae bacterium]